MDRQEIIETLKSIIEDYLKIQQLDLVDLIYRQEGRGLILRILIDRPQGGITLGECTRLNREISAILDERDILKMNYVMEVSSPGLGRILKTKADFCRCINRRVRFFFNEPINGKAELEGVIIKVENDSACVDIEDKIMEIPLSKINRGKQVIE